MPVIALRKLSESDTEQYFAAHDEEAERNFHSVPHNLEEAKKEIKAFLKAYEVPIKERKKEGFALEVDGKFAGWVAIHHIEYGIEATMGCLVAPSFRGKGVGTEAMKKALAYAFKTYQLQKVLGRVLIHNKASQKMLKKAGFVFEKEIEDGKKLVFVKTF